jgi:subtilisin family serine protease
MTAASPTGGRQPGGAALNPLATTQSLNDLPLPADPSFVVGVIDTGIALVDGRPHPFLAGHLAGPWQGNEDRPPPSGEPLDRYHGHGTFVAGLILNEAPAATIDMRNALDESVTKGTDNDIVVAQAIRDLAEVPDLRLVNMSFFGEPGQEYDEPLVIKRALEDLFRARPEVVVVTAAGNADTNTLVWPAAFSRTFEQVVAVGAVDETVSRPGAVPPKASFSNFGSWVGAYAAGVQVLGPSPFHRELSRNDGLPAQTFAGWSRWSGTSFAAATVTGLIAQAMIDGYTGPRAREQVLRGPRVRSCGMAEEYWAPYVRGTSARAVAKSNA